MKTIKVGQLNFWDKGGEDTGAELIGMKLIRELNDRSLKYKFEYVEDPYNNECDLIIYSLWGHLSNLQKCKGNPTFIYYTIENSAIGDDEITNQDPFEYYRNGNYSISFYDDSPTNCFYPYFIDFWWLVKWKRDYSKLVYPQNLNKFCGFVAKNSNYYQANFRTEFVEKLMNYKKVDCWGPVLNNTNGQYLPFFYKDAYNIMKDYKFYVSFENDHSNGNLSYITEKIMWGYFYQTIPIYWGAERITEWFNPDSFINANGLSHEEIIQKVKEIDNNDELALYMLNQYPFKDPYVDYELIFQEKITKFIENICDNLGFTGNKFYIPNNVNKNIENINENNLNEKTYTIWCTYHDPSMKFDFNLKNSEHFKLIDLSNNDTGEYENINSLNNHLSEIPSLYYVWKNNIKSDYVGFCQYRRHFTWVNFDKLEEGQVQVYKKWDLEFPTRYEAHLDIGIGEYITYMFMKYIFEKRPNIDRQKVRDYIYGNKTVISNKHMFICKWDIFCDICDFIFGFLEYFIPNGDWKNPDALVECALDLKALDDIVAKYYENKGEDHRWVTLKAEGRQIASYIEWFWGLYVNLCYDTWVEEWDAIHDRKNIVLQLKREDYGKLKTWYNLNLFSGIQNIYVIIDGDPIPEDFNCDSPYHLWYNYEFIIWKKPEDELPQNYIKLSIDEYIDVDSPIDYHMYNHYQIKKIVY